MVNVRLDGVYLSNPSLYTSQNATTEMVKMDLSSDLGLMRNGTDSLDSFLLERRLMKGKASGKGGGGTRNLSGLRASTQSPHSTERTVSYVGNHKSSREL